jgi:hypothetical protein
VWCCDCREFDLADRKSDHVCLMPLNRRILHLTEDREPHPHQISLAQCIELERRIKWSNIDISFRPKDHPETKLSNRNLPFMVKLPIGWHKVAQTLVDNGASLNLTMRKTFIEMSLNLSDLTPVHDVLHSVIPGQSSTPSHASTSRYPMGWETLGTGRC